MIMADQQNRRKNRILGFEFDISIKWLIGIIILGLVQFGVFWEQFRQVGGDISDVKQAVKEIINVARIVENKDVQQDTRIYELERRLNERDRRRPLDAEPSRNR